MSCVCVHLSSSISESDEPIFTKFGINIMPFETTSTSQFLFPASNEFVRQDTSSS